MKDTAFILPLFFFIILMQQSFIPYLVQVVLRFAPLILIFIPCFSSLEDFG
jgi:hypothetical protein